MSYSNIEQRKDTKTVVKNLTPTNYFSQRITELGLTEEEAFRHGLGYDKDGNVLQFIRNFNGNIIEYLPLFGKERKRWNKIQNRSTSYNLHEEGFLQKLFITRYTPQYLQNNPNVGKYKFPSKRFTGLSTFPMPSNLAIENFLEEKEGGVVSFIEGYFKAVAASKHGLEFTAFTGNTTYKLDDSTKEYVLTRNPSDIVISYDGDTQDLSKGIVTPKRINGFKNSALRFGNQLFDFCKEEGLQTKIYYCQINPQQNAKGLDDLLQEGNVEEVVEAFRSMTTSNYFQFIRLYKTKIKKQLEEHFHTKNHVDFYNKYEEEIKENEFIFNGAKYQLQTIHRNNDGTPLQSNQLTIGNKVFSYFKLKNNPFSIAIDGKEITVNKYISEAEEAIIKEIINNTLLAINAPTGSGKTTLFLQIAKRLNIPIVLCVPTVLLCEQLTAKCKKLGMDVYGLHGSVTPVKKCKAEMSKITICTYDTLPKINLSNRWLIIDESHNLINGFGLNKSFRENTVRKILEMTATAKKTILISGTQNKHLCKFLGFRYIEVKQKKHQKVNVVCVESDKPKMAILERLKAINWKENKIHFVYQNNTEELHRIKDFLINNGILTEAEVEVVSRSDVNNGTDKVYNQIIKNGKITGIKLVLATCIIAEGVDILNTNIGKILTVDINCIDTFKQLSARFRLMESVTVYSIRGKEKILNPLYFLNTEIEVDRMKAEAEIKVRTIEHQKEYLEHISDYEEEEMAFFDDINPNYNYKTDLFKNTYTTMEGMVAVDILRILAIERNRKLTWINNSAFYSELAEHDNIYLQGNEVEEITTDTKEAVEEIIKTTKERKAASIELAKDLLLNTPSILIESLFFHAKKRRSNIAEFIGLTWYDGTPPHLQNDDSKKFYKEHEEAFLQNWSTSIVKSFLILHYLGILEANIGMIKSYSKTNFNTFFRGVKMAALNAIYLNRNYRKHLTKLHKTEIKLFRKLKPLMAEFIEAEGGRVAEEKMAAFIREKVMDKGINVGGVKLILLNLYSFTVIRKSVGNIYTNFEEIFVEEHGKNYVTENMHFWKKNERNLLKIIDLICLFSA